MRSLKERKGRTPADHELKAVQGGTTTPSDQNSDARAIVIDVGASSDARAVVIDTGAS